MSKKIEKSPAEKQAFIDGFKAGYKQGVVDLGSKFTDTVSKCFDDIKALVEAIDNDKKS